MTPMTAVKEQDTAAPGSFELVFLDPPFDSDLSGPALAQAATEGGVDGVDEG